MAPTHPLVSLQTSEDAFWNHGHPTTVIPGCIQEWIFGSIFHENVLVGYEPRIPFMRKVCAWVVLARLDLSGHKFRRFDFDLWTLRSVVVLIF